MKKIVSFIVMIVLIVASLSACSKTNNESGDKVNNDSVESVTTDNTKADKESASEKKRSVGFVTFGLGSDFFQSLADAFVEKMIAAGWDAQYADGEFNPTKQIEAFENFVAMQVDVIVLWSVAPEAMDSAVKEAMDRGIKVVAFVAPTSQYDVLMIADTKELADNCARLAAQWIDSTFADEEDHSVPVAVFSCRVAETGVVQADELIKIEEFSKKAKFVIEVENEDETMDTGLKAAENLYITHPELKVFLTAHNGLALGINNYFTGINSPVTDYSDMGIFTVNGDVSMAEIIKTSTEGLSPLRGMVLTGSADETAEEICQICIGIMDGSLESGHIQKAKTIFVNAETVDEYLATGTVTSVTEEDFK